MGNVECYGLIPIRTDHKIMAAFVAMYLFKFRFMVFCANSEDVSYNKKGPVFMGLFC